MEKRLHEYGAAAYSREGVYATLLGADCFEATGFEAGSADETNKSADHQESEELTVSATATECQAPSPVVVPSLSAMEKRRARTRTGTRHLRERHHDGGTERPHDGSMAEGPDSSSCVSEHDDGEVADCRTAADVGSAARQR